MACCLLPGSEVGSNKPGALSGLEKHTTRALLGAERLMAPMPVAHTGFTVLTPAADSDDSRYVSTCEHGL